MAHASECARTMHAQRMHSPWRYRARAKGARASFVRLQVCSYGRAVEDWGAGAASHLGLQLSTFCDLDGEGSPCFLRARHPRAWGAARSSNPQSSAKALLTPEEIIKKIYVLSRFSRNCCTFWIIDPTGCHKVGGGCHKTIISCHKATTPHDMTQNHMI